MKIRSDFVTNSSSSSFILAQKGEWSEEQKQAMLDFVKSTLLGEVLLTPDSTEEEIQKMLEQDSKYEENEAEIRKALQEGKTIYGGCVIYENCDEQYADMFIDLWRNLERCSNGDFEAIDGDLLD